MKTLNNYTKGILRENPVLVLVLGTCPTLATSTRTGGDCRPAVLEHPHLGSAEGHSR